MISYGKQTINQDDIDCVIEALKSDWLTQGPLGNDFEKCLSEYFGSNYACVLSSGTAALHLLGLVLGWEKGDVVLTTPNTFLASANCIVYSGATPDFVDIDSKSYTIDPNQLEEKIKSYRTKGKNVKAIIGVDYAGHPCDWKALKAISDKYNLQLVNDNCHALGAEYEGSKQYASLYADAVTQSYHPVKHITTGEGGSVLTNIPNIDEKIRLLRTHGITKDQEILSENEGPWYYEMVELGYNYRITDFQCSLGINQLKKLDVFVNKRRKLALEYDNTFINDNRFIIPAKAKNILHSYHLYPLQIRFDKLEIDRKELFLKMRERGIMLQVHYIPVHFQPYYKKKYFFKKGDFPNSEEFYSQEISLPIYPGLSIDDQQMVIESLYKVLDE